MQIRILPFSHKGVERTEILFSTSVVDTGGKFASGVVDTSGNFLPPVANFVAGVFGYRWCTLTSDYLREFLKKFEMTPVLFSGTLFH